MAASSVSEKLLRRRLSDSEDIVSFLILVWLLDKSRRLALSES